MVNKYQKKPVVVEAIQLTDTDVSRIDVYNFINGIGEPKGPGELWPYHEFARWIDDNFPIETLEGTMHASYGDYIIKGVKGEFYPCKPDIFIATYSKQIDMATLTSEELLALPEIDLNFREYEKMVALGCNLFQTRSLPGYIAGFIEINHTWFRVKGITGNARSLNGIIPDIAPLPASQEELHDMPSIDITDENVYRMKIPAEIATVYPDDVTKHAFLFINDQWFKWSNAVIPE